MADSQTSLLQPLVAALEELTQTTYEQHTAALRIIADHVRGAVFLAFDGVRPGNKDQGYVMRRLLRRAMGFAFGLGIEKNFFSALVPVVVSLYQDAYPEMAPQQENIEAVPTKEERSFRRTLAKGLRELQHFSAGGQLGDHAFFTLSDTYGFPTELSHEEAVSRGMDVSPNWRDEFDTLLSKQRARSQKQTTLGAK